ncbi:MAG: hypothetical protein H5U37_04680 [Caldisericia bacterium]|nr:hypothetical protein [Caldisericia bacterium]
METKVPNPEDPNGNLIDDFLGYFEVPIYNLIDKDGYYYWTKYIQKEKSQILVKDKLINQIEKFSIDNFEYKYLDSINIVRGNWIKNELGVDIVEGGSICVVNINDSGKFLLNMSSRKGDEKDVLEYLIFDPFKSKLYSIYLPINVNIFGFIDNKIYAIYEDKNYFVIMKYSFNLL